MAIGHSLEVSCHVYWLLDWIDYRNWKHLFLNFWTGAIAAVGQLNSADEENKQWRQVIK